MFHNLCLSVELFLKGCIGESRYQFIIQSLSVNIKQESYAVPEGILELGNINLLSEIGHYCSNHSGFYTMSRPSILLFLAFIRPFNNQIIGLLSFETKIKQN